MTVHELRQALENFPGDQLVLVGYRDIDGDLLAQDIGGVRKHGPEELFDGFGIKIDDVAACVLLAGNAG